MDAVKFIKERDRMCKSYYDAENGHCSDGCPAHDTQCTDLDDLSADAEELVALVEEWSDAHPRKTRQSVFLGNYPCARIDRQSVLYACPADVYGYNVCPRKKDTAPITCSECRREFWMQEVE